MPTNFDETTHERYAREHAAYLAGLAKMTPEQIADLDLARHNAEALLSWAYWKLVNYSFSKQEDALKMDEIKLLLEFGHE